MDLYELATRLEHTKGLKPNSARLRVQKVEYLFGLLNIDTDDIYIPGVVAGLYKSGLHSDLFALPIMSASRATTRNLVHAFFHLCDFSTMVCGRRDHREATRCITQLKIEILAPIKKRVSKEKRSAAIRKNELDSDLIDGLPSVPVLQAAILLSIVDLHIVWLDKRGTALGAVTKCAINAIAIGLVFLNQYAGRPGEWMSTTRRRVEE